MAPISSALHPAPDVDGIPGEGLNLTPSRPAGARAKTSMTKRIGMSEAARQAKCAKPRVDHAWIADFAAINGPWARMTRKLIWINDSICALRGAVSNCGRDIYETWTHRLSRSLRLQFNLVNSARQ